MRGTKRMVRLPRSILRPMLATLVDAPFDDAAFVFETKWDGFRVVAQVGERACNHLGAAAAGRRGQVHREWTKDGRTRHPVFLSLRTDKAASQVVRERPKRARRI